MMSRLLLYPFAGAACGAMAAMIVVPSVAGANADTAAITLFIGTFLAGSGAIAGAVLAGAEVLAAEQRVALLKQHTVPSDDVAPSPPHASGA